MAEGLICAHDEEIDSLRAKLVSAEKDRERVIEISVKNSRRANAAEDREEKLREALEAIERRVVHCISEWGLEVREIARAALAAVR